MTVTVGEFRESAESLIDYIFEHEVEDFFDQIEDEDGYPANHVYFAAFIAWNGMRELDGKEYASLWNVLHDNHDGQYYHCTENCGYIGTKADPIQDRLILGLPSSEPMPAGVCPVCAGTVCCV